MASVLGVMLRAADSGQGWGGWAKNTWLRGVLNSRSSLSGVQSDNHTLALLRKRRCCQQRVLRRRIASYGLFLF